MSEDPLALRDWNVSARSPSRGRENILGYIQRTLGRASREGRCWSFRTNHGLGASVVLHFYYCVRYASRVVLRRSPNCYVQGLVDPCWQADVVTNVVARPVIIWNRYRLLSYLTISN